MSGSRAAGSRGIADSRPAWITPPRPPAVSSLARIQSSDPWSSATVTLTESRLVIVNGSLALDVALHDIVNIYEIDDAGSIEIEQRNGSTVELSLDEAMVSDLLNKLNDGSGPPPPPVPESLLTESAAPAPAWIEPDHTPTTTRTSAATAAPPVATGPPPYVGPNEVSPPPDGISTTEQSEPESEEAPAAEGAGACPYCQTPADGELTECPRCHAAHHRDCWVEAGGCAMVGCVQSVPAAAAAQNLAGQPGMAAAPVLPASPSSGQPLMPTANTWGGTTPAAVPGIAASMPTTTSPANFTMQPARRGWTKFLLGVLLIGLPISAVVATTNNWLEQFTGHLYSEPEYQSAKDRAFSDGRSKGFDEGESEGYDKGKSAGYDEGLAAGIEKGCLAVFDAVGSYVLYDRPYSSYLSTTYIGKSSCYG